MAATSSTPAPARRIGFLDLSPELRNKVYHLSLISRTPIRVHYGYLPTLKRIRVVRKKTCRATLTTGLLKTCKTVYYEAAPVLYGNNLISVSFSGRALSDFFDLDIRRWEQHVRFVRLEKLMGGGHFQAALRKLAKLRGLERLDIAYDPAKSGCSLETMAEALMPLVDAFKEVDTETGEVKGKSMADALGMVRFVELEDDRSSMTEEDGLTDSERYTKRVKAVLSGEPEEMNSDEE